MLKATSPHMAVLSVSVLLAGCSREQPDSHLQMLEALEEIRLASSDDVYLGDAPLRVVQEQLDALGPGGDPRRRFELLCQVSAHRMRLGRTDEAVKDLEAAERILLEGGLNPPTETIEQMHLWLATAHLRRGENANCVDCINGESCIVPIQAGGIHTDPDGSTQAIKHLTELLKINPDNTTAIWLLNIANMTLGEYPDKVPQQFLIDLDRFGAADNFPRFVNIAKEKSIDTFSLCGGAVIDDFNGDGFLDIVASSWAATSQIQLFLNNGDGSFSNQTSDSGLTGILGGLNMIQADYDNDGDVDLYVLRGAWLGPKGDHPNSLLQNDGHGRFRDVTMQAGLAENNHPTQTASWADFDNDGDLDLYVGNENVPCQLFENDGQGRFKDIAAQAGVQNRRFAKSVIFGDYDGDRWPDIYVSNMDQPNRLYRNNGKGMFFDVSKDAGVRGPSRSFPSWFWDVNNDGNLDLIVTAYAPKIEDFVADFTGKPHEGETNTLYLNDGDGGYRDVSEEFGVNRITIPMGANFGDLDNDGFQDYYLGTGYPEFYALMPNRMFRNDGGTRFVEVTRAGGFGHLQKGHGVSFADWDHDGDQDVFIEMGGAFPGDAFGNALFENPGFGNHWIALHLVGTKSNRSAIGARIRLSVEEAGESRTIYKWVNSGGTFGCNPLRQHIGVGKAERIKELEIYWPTSDTRQVFQDVDVDQFLQITEGASKWVKQPYQPINRPTGDSGITVSATPPPDPTPRDP